MLTVTFSPSASAARDDVAGFAAAIFDMDGVVTQTAATHALAWKRMFDEFLLQDAARRGEPFREFTRDGDYLAHVDGRPRYRGVETFLRSRGLELPFGSPADDARAETVCSLGNRKNELFNAIVAQEGVAVYDSTVALIRALLAAGVRVGLATSSRNAAMILARTGTADLFATVVDGVVSERLGLRGKPEPDIFTTACANLGATPARTLVFEDAVSGVEAGARGGFGLVVGVARENNAPELRAHGADCVVADLGELDLAGLRERFAAQRAARGILT